MKKAKEDLIDVQCEEIESCLDKSSNKKAYQLVKDLTSEEQGRPSTIQERSRENTSRACSSLRETIIDVLTEICRSRIWRTGEWPTPWSQSLIILLPRKVSLLQCQNYRTISLISHPSKDILKVILNRLNPKPKR